MPKNTGIGGKKRKMGKKNHHNSERELVYKEEMQDYAQVLRLLGDSRLEVQCMDTVKRMAHIRGTMRKKVWIAMGDVVLVALREYESDKCDIILKYTEDEVRKLKSLGEIPATIKLPENENKEKDDGGDWGLGIGDWANPQSPIPNPQSPIPNPQLIFLIKFYHI
jgi:translation initiation factor 1A